jgi:hypothetical protein
MTTRTYYGCILYPVTRPTTWGARWETYVAGTWLMADTLEGIKASVRSALGK